MSEYPAYVLYGHHKCATMSLNAIARSVCRRLGLRFQAVFDDEQFGRNLGEFVTKHKTEFLAYGNADLDYVSQLPEHTGAHIVRDPRDIVVSAYFSHRYSHSTAEWKALAPHREKLQRLSKDDGLMAEIDFREKSFRQMGNWDYEQPNIYEFQFEDLVASPYDTLVRVYQALGLLDNDHYGPLKRMGALYREACSALFVKTGLRWPGRLNGNRLPAPEFLTIAWRNRFEARTKGRKEGDENERSHYRKGQSGDWKNHFSEAHKAHFKARYPGLVPQLGYADDDDW